MPGVRREGVGDRARQSERASIVQLVVLGAIASAIGVALALVIDWFPVAASRQAGDIDTLWDVLLIASVPVFVLVQAIVLYSVWRFRMRPGQEQQDGPPTHGNTRLEVIWTVIPAILILGLCAYAYVVLEDIEEAQANEMRIDVVGQQFAWTFEYPQQGGEPVRSNQLYLAEGRPVQFHVKSRDVIHDFWVPAFRMKIDAVPGITTRYRVTPTKKGTFPVVCAELCGLGHAFMRQRARVVSAGEFDAWLEKRKQPAGGEAGGGGAVDAKTLFAQGNGAATACGACHTLADAGTSGGTGPDLDEVLKGFSEAEIRKAILEPDAEIAKGFGRGIMPGNFGETLSPEELDALVTYLHEVTR